ncbi:MAG: hypothetical protein WAK11_13440 [Candidatus Cybelea sp.]
MRLRIALIGSWAYAMKVISLCATAWAAIFIMAAAPLDMAVIDGSRDSRDYRIVVYSDGSASIAAAASAPRAFTIPEETVTQFFAALAASQNNPSTGVVCAKHAPFDSTIHVTWHGWVSGDVACPASWIGSGATQPSVALNHSVMEIIVLAGQPAAFPCTDLPANDRPPGCGSKRSRITI